MAALALRRAAGLPAFDADLAADLRTSRDTIRRRLREARMSAALMRTPPDPGGDAPMVMTTPAPETPQPETVVRAGPLVVCVACGTAIPMADATGLFAGSDPTAVAWVCRPGTSSLCLRRALEAHDGAPHALRPAA